MGLLDLGVGLRFSVLLLVLSFGFCSGDTDQRDVFAINSLYVALRTPRLRGWQAQDGDPCGARWQGVECVFSNITALKLDNANLEGELGENLGSFSSIISMDFRGNRIGGPIPKSLPITLRNLYLSGNQFTGPIPDSLATLSQLTDLSLSENILTGEIPDSFGHLKLLVTLELADNELSGPLPPSMAALSSLITLNMQNNQITGTLDVLQDLPVLANLNVENNLLSGPIPPPLLALPNFRSAGNPFNTTIIPSSPITAAFPASPVPSPGLKSVPRKPLTGSSEPDINAPKTTVFTTKRLLWITLAVLVLFVVIGMTLSFFMLKSHSWLQATEGFGKPPHTSPVNGFASVFKYKDTMSRQNNPLKQEGKEVHQQIEGKHEHDIEKGVVLAPKPPPFSPPVTSQSNAVIPRKSNFSETVICFSIAELQQCTQSFSQENLIGKGSLGSVYRGILPDGKGLAVRTLNNATTLCEDNFLELVSIVSNWKHRNVVELVGYSQYILAFEYYRNGTLYDALHVNDEIHSKLSWNRRMMIALGAAKALEYLHETCQPPVTHNNFKSVNLLLDHKLTVSVSDCGLSSFMCQDFRRFKIRFVNVISNVSLNLSANGYEAPELEAGSHTVKSDIYSFGVVMLELLTARKPYDRSRPRGEQCLVSWALSQLHDIETLSRMVDPTLNGAYPTKSLSRFADIISLCLQPEPEFRPPMSEIVGSIMHLIPRPKNTRVGDL